MMTITERIERIHANRKEQQRRMLEASMRALTTGEVIFYDGTYCLYDAVEYCMKVLNPKLKPEDVGLHEKFRECGAFGFCCNTLLGHMKCITLLLEDDEYDYHPVPDNMSDNVADNYQFCFVINTTCPDCNEYGDCFFEKREDGSIHRVS